MPAPIPIYGRILRELRHLRRLSQAELAEQAGLDPPQISRYEAEDTSPTPAHLDWIVTALKLSDAEVRALIRTPALDAALSQTMNGKPANRRELFELAAAGTGGLISAGWSASYVQLPAEAAAWVRHTEHLADQADIAFVHGEVLASKASLHRPVVGDGDARKGLDFAQAAAPLVDTHGPLAKYIANLEAEMHAALPRGEDDRFARSKLVARRRNPLVPNCACIPPRVVARRSHTQQVCALLAPRDAGADRTLTFKRLQRRTTRR
jgi:transcriptional regulator with XRE-family HTH domain